MYAMDEEDSEHAEEVHDMEGDPMADVIAWCLLAEKVKCAMAASDQQTRKTKNEESQSSITAERRKQSQIRPKKKSLK